MESFLNGLNTYWTSIKDGLATFDIPIGKIIAVIIILIFTQMFRRVFASVIAKSIERLTKNTETTLDDELIAILKPSLSLLFLIAGLWAVYLILGEYLSPQLNETIGAVFNMTVLAIIASVVYRSAALLGKLLADTVLRTETDLDELIKPFTPLVFQTAAVAMIVLKGSEIFLGKSAGALVGLLGGAGITLGLLFKDVIYDWFCTIIVYSDHLYREGDWLFVSGISGFTQVAEIGMRSTKLRVTSWGCIKKIPNSQMIGGIVENWSQTATPEDKLMWGINWTLKIDGISAEKTARVCAGLKEIPKSVKGLSDNKYMIRFAQLEGNARVIHIRVFVDDPNLYFDAETDFNLAVLAFLEMEGVDTLYVELRTDPQTYKQSLVAAAPNN